MSTKIIETLGTIKDGNKVFIDIDIPKFYLADSVKRYILGLVCYLHFVVFLDSDISRYFDL